MGDGDLKKTKPFVIDWSLGREELREEPRFLAGISELWNIWRRRKVRDLGPEGSTKG